MRGLVACVLMAGCAARQIPIAQQEAYFTCLGIVVDTASENLQRAGYITDWRDGDRAIETRWVSYSMNPGDEGRILFLRYVVEAATDGVTFSVFERSDEQKDDVRGEAPWDRITQSQVDDPGVHELLEKIRRDVCGTDTPFFVRRHGPPEHAERRAEDGDEAESTVSRAAEARAGPTMQHQPAWNSE